MDYLHNNFESFNMENGIKVALKHLPIPDVLFQITILGGSIFDPPDKLGLSHMGEHIFFETDLPYNKNFNLELYRITGRKNPTASTGDELIVIDARMPYENLPESLPLLRAALLSTDFHESSYKLVKKVISNEKIAEDIPGTLPNLVRYLSMYHYYPHHPLGNPIGGTLDSINNIQIEDIQKFKLETIQGKNLILKIVGNFDEGLRQLIEEQFGDINPGTKRQLLFDDTPDLTPVAVEGDFPGLLFPQYTRVYGIPGLRSQNTVHIEILTQYMAGGINSRLGQVIRKEQGDIYNTDFNMTNLFNRGLGILNIVGFNPEKIEDIIMHVNNEIERVKQGEFDIPLLNIVKASFRKTLYEDIFETLDTQAGEIEYQLRGYPYTIEQQLNIWETAQPKELAKVAQELLTDYVEIRAFP